MVWIVTYVTFRLKIWNRIIDMESIIYISWILKAYKNTLIYFALIGIDDHEPF